METVDTKMMPNKCAAANRHYPIQFMTHRFYNITGFGVRPLPAAVLELGR